MHEGKHVHFIGIGGYGMGPLAKIMLDMGYVVSGSDIKVSERTERMAGLGAKISIGHSEENVDESVSSIVVSAAVPESNPELQKAGKLKIPIYTHAEMVGSLMEDKVGIGISGAHGKTTTTSMVSLVLWRSGLSPTVLIGGEVEEFSGGGKLGSGKYFVVEADEAYGRFLKMKPKIAAVTNIDDDHLDYYGTFDNILSAFDEFIGKLPENGLAILNIDNAYVKALASRCSKRRLTYSTQGPADLWASDITLKEFGSSFTIHRGDELLGNVELAVPGYHNVSNSLVAIAVGLEVGASFQQIVAALRDFHGAHRRFELHGIVNDVMIVDDYAHHPTEIKAVLKAAKEGWKRRLIAVFQPQRFSRTQLLMDEFAKAFDDADLVIINDIYYEGTGEEPIPGVTSARLATLTSEIRKAIGKEGTTFHIGELTDTTAFLDDLCKAGDLVITMGAGNVWRVANDLPALLGSKNDSSVKREAMVSQGEKGCK